MNQEWIRHFILAIVLSPITWLGVQAQYPGQACSPVNYLATDPNDCTKFYSCTTYGYVSMDCPDPLFFNEPAQICDWPYNVPSCTSRTTTDACNPNPCGTGTCYYDSSQPGGFGCIITTTDVCNPNPCFTGTCYYDASQPGGWVCVCPVGYSGQDCGTVTTTDVCNPSLCLRGTCYYDASQPGGWACVCPVGYTGQDCGTVTTTDVCNPSPCLRGDCYYDASQPGGWACVCPVGYSGQDCGTVTTTDVCNPSPCLRGNCYYDASQPGGWVCACPVGYSGQDCGTFLGSVTTASTCPIYPCPSDVPRYFYPDWNDYACASYYACEYGILERRTCLTGYLFDLISQACQIASEPTALFCTIFRITG